ncbi:MAG: SUMF1/EgtB/PvdO family nonheme iron enzyme [Hyphomicrobiaceae bacterium]
MFGRSFFALACFCIGSVVSFQAAAQKRVALVMGNSDYAHTTKLKNPSNDATLFATTLKRLGFEVILQTDLGLKAMQRAIRSYLALLDAGGTDAVGLVYYAGHGVQVEGVNYLVPTDARIDREGDVAIESVSASKLLAGLRMAKNNLNIIILDACRNNPFRGFSRSAARGLARLDAPRGSYIVFATAPGDVAADGAGDNSPFTEALSRYMATPGLNVEQIIKRVGRQVSKTTGGRQRPWLSSSVYDDFFPAGRGVGKWATVTQGRSNAANGPAKSLAANAKPAPVQAPAKVASVFRDCPACPELVVVPPGRFEMGSANARFRDRNQEPLHAVTIKRPLAVGRFEVTFDEWEACLKGGGCAGYNPRDEDWGRGRRPVIRVNWEDAITYVEWLKFTTKKPYRLLSEAELEYVARAGSKTLFSTGDTITTYQANFDGRRSYNNGPKGRLLARTSEVGSYKPNAFGVFDMHGNVAEWLSDCWHKNYQGAPSDGSSWLTPPRGQRCTRRIVRSGSYFRSARFIRSSARYSMSPSLRSRETGLRVARDLDD